MINSEIALDTVAYFEIHSRRAFFAINSCDFLKNIFAILRISPSGVNLEINQIALERDIRHVTIFKSKGDHVVRNFRDKLRNTKVFQVIIEFKIQKNSRVIKASFLGYCTIVKFSL